MKVDWNLILKLNRNNRYPDHAGYTDNAGSKDAAEMFEPQAEIHRQVLREWFRKNPQGGNPKLIAISLGMEDAALSFRSRCTELTDKEFLVKTDLRTELPSGIMGAVYQLNACNSTQNKDN